MKISHNKWCLVSITFLVTLSLIGCTSPTSTPTLTSTLTITSTETLTTTPTVTEPIITSPPLTSTTGSTNTTVIGTVLDITGNIIAVQKANGGTIFTAYYPGVIPNNVKPGVTASVTGKLSSGLIYADTDKGHRRKCLACIYNSDTAVGANRSCSIFNSREPLVR